MSDRIKVADLKTWSTFSGHPQLPKLSFSVQSSIRLVSFKNAPILAQIVAFLPSDQPTLVTKKKRSRLFAFSSVRGDVSGVKSDDVISNSELPFVNGGATSELAPSLLSPIRRILRGGTVCKEVTRLSTAPGHGEGFICSPRGKKVFVQQWLPGRKPKALVFISHGLNEHSGRYDHVARQLNEAGYAVFAWDHHGHGRSDGIRAYVERFDFIVDDAVQYVNRVQRNFPNTPTFMVGHSMGGSVAIQSSRALKGSLNGLVLSAPAVLIHPIPILKKLAPIVATIAPTLPSSPVPGKASTRCAKSALAKKQDPLVYKGPVRARTGYELIKTADNIQANMHTITVPFLVMHGTADSTTDPEGSKSLYRMAASHDKAIRLYNGLYHDLFHEAEKQLIVKDMVRWMDAHIPASQRRTKSVSNNIKEASRLVTAAAV
mmetsp:Transcript_23017/g.39555  ORF Transcript_23017/g.39555 Transcript_23017/m.39555 type:complete len:431 (+) Transcript_23017:190-1482(+)|eukprot:CAMPEP_0196657916 /NCGR_PEP_ID=MMETSP1086-20130531/26399_1 /TAXON_ID=77921 /ORGANISM="Cyanoptyche  gloeocystis , Strain SAG4.97" /LENGTH=430 /DNA_ID=CAMNT_0041991239 /DNA_START=184 /DNA_END=1476 /DNA_ORIENTATION=-